MTAIARGQSSSVTTPILVAVVRDEGFLADPYSLQYQIFDTSSDVKRLVPVQVFPVTLGTKATVNLSADRLGLGRFAALWSAGGSETLGRHLVRWYWKLTATSTEATWDREFEVLAGAGYGSQMPASYAMLCDLREQGITDTDASDAKLLLLANEASRFVERCTSRFFEPRHQVVGVDGRGGSRLLLEQPLIAVEEVALVSPYIDDSDVDAGEYKIYNRHLDGILSPDDRENPQIGLAYAPEDVGQDAYGMGEFLSRTAWPRGKQNVQVTGVWGYTDPDGSPAGETPREIVRVTMALVYRNLPTLTSADRDDRRWGSLVTGQTVRDQSISRKAPSDLKGASTGFTGDAEIDTVLVRFRRPPFMGAS